MVPDGIRGRRSSSQTGGLSLAVEAVQGHHQVGVGGGPPTHARAQSSRRSARRPAVGRWRMWRRSRTRA